MGKNILELVRIFAGSLTFKTRKYGFVERKDIGECGLGQHAVLESGTPLHLVVVITD